MKSRIALQDRIDRKLLRVSPRRFHRRTPLSMKMSLMIILCTPEFSLYIDSSTVQARNTKGYIMRSKSGCTAWYNASRTHSPSFPTKRTNTAATGYLSLHFLLLKLAHSSPSPPFLSRRCSSHSSHSSHSCYSSSSCDSSSAVASP
jgi:hypothetical protein